MPKRRGNNEGSFYFRNSDDRWVAVYQGRTKTHKVRKEAWKLWEKMKREVAAGYNHKAASRGDTLESYLKRLIRATHADATKACYASSLIHILPYLGSRPIATITVRDINLWLEQLDEKLGDTRRTARHKCYSLVKRAFKLAFKEDAIVVSPCDKAEKPPRGRRKRMFPPTSEESAKIIAETQSDRYHVAYALGLLAGMRPCEIFGLRWSRINWNRRILTVDQTAVVCKGKPGVKLQQFSKTDNGFREIPLMPQLIHALEIRMRQATSEGLFGDNHLVVPRLDGSPTHRGYFLDGPWEKTLKALGLERRTFYTARHSCASLMLESGVSMKMVSQILGHSDPKITMQHYAHVLDEDPTLAMEKLSEKLTRSSAKLSLHDDPIEHATIPDRIANHEGSDEQ